MKSQPCTILAVLTALASAAQADITTNLTSTADSAIHQFSPDSNFGADPTMAAGDTSTVGNNEIRRALLAFDLTGNIPSNATITSVQLQLIVTKVPLTGAVSSTFDLLRLLKPWDELTVTWNSASTGVAWEQAGVTGASDSASTASSTVFVSTTGAYVFPSTPDLVADVQAAVDGSAPSFGWLLRSESEGTLKTAKQFGTHDDTIIPANAPVLTVTYTVPNTQPPAVPPTLTQLSVSGGQFLFTFNAQSNRTYVVESRPNAASGTWSTVSNVPAQPGDTTIAISDPITGTRNFYRVRTP
jgi:hypothetical protein